MPRRTGYIELITGLGINIRVPFFCPNIFLPIPFALRLCVKILPLLLLHSPSEESLEMRRLFFAGDHIDLDFLEAGFL